MTTQEYKRRLSAIVSADVEGYSRLMRDDEEATVRTITAYRTPMSHLIEQYRGRVVDSPGDNVLAEFTRVVDAVQFRVAVESDGFLPPRPTPSMISRFGRKLRRSSSTGMHKRLSILALSRPR